MDKNRVLAMIVTMMAALLILIGRLAQIQIVETESFSSQQINLLEESVAQRTKVWIVNSGRGQLADRNGEALSDPYYPALILFPFLKEMDWPHDKVANILAISPSALMEQLQKAKEPFMVGEPEPLPLTTKQMEEINALNIPGVIAVEQQFKRKEQLAQHLLGITGENEQEVRKRYAEKLKDGSISRNTHIGITGLQYSFDEFLLAQDETRLLYHVDNLGNPLFGLDVRYTAPSNPYYPMIIQTTLDKTFQRKIEEIIDSYQMKKGAVVLLDIDTNTIIALASRPALDRENPFGDEGGKNHAITIQFPGSVFKIVTAAAAIDQNIQLRGRSFNCDLNLYGEPGANRKLGTLDFKESFAQSCNYTFAALANELMAQDPDILEDYAAKLGLTDLVGWQGDLFHFEQFQQLQGEEKGTVWGENAADRHAPKAIAQTAIGQKEVKVSPLAVANMMATIARGGEKEMVRAVQAIQYKNRTTLFEFPNKPLAGERLSPYTISRLQSLLKEVVKSGTGKEFSSLPYSVAGKSGTAETGKDNLINKWFAGYFPAEKPKYALVVVEIEQASYEENTNEIFANIVEGIFELE